jgi:hypothetical protein
MRVIAFLVAVAAIAAAAGTAEAAAKRLIASMQYPLSPAKA